jgi:hypothetical protein
MKRAKKEYLKSMKITGFKWDMDPITMYKACEDTEGVISVSKRDLKKLIDIAILRDINRLRIIQSLGHELGY